MKVLIISATSDIGYALCRDWRDRGYEVYGTFRSESEQANTLRVQGIELFHCDFADIENIERVAEELKKPCRDWDVVVFAPGTQLPIGLFEDCNMQAWLESVHINFLNQFALLHKLLPMRNLTAPKGVSVLFFAGGGVNNAVPYYSAYTISKIACIKMCELLDAELEDLRISIVGPGWVKTKIHEETLQADEKSAGHNYFRVRERIKDDNFIPMERVIDFCNWILLQEKCAVSGRNFSIENDMWGSEKLIEALMQDDNMYKLRRFGNSWGKEKI